MKKTKIICTIGPASDSEKILREMFKAGLNVCRLNFSHGSHEEHKIKVDKIKKLRKEMELPIAIMLDTKGPEIRLGKFEKSVKILEGQEYVFSTKDIIGDNQRCHISYKNIANEITTNHSLLVNDGLMEFKVINILNETDIECVAINSGILSSRKGVNIPGFKVDLPYMSEKDIADINFAIDNDLDFIAASFTQCAGDILQIKKILKERDSKINVIAKIENQEGLNNLDAILEVSDGIMVARGDLGVEIPPQEIPHAQKRLIRKANIAGKPVITATQMLESMTHNLRPTRAEVTDVANAILDGTSAVMLSGETAAGEYPVETVKMMNSIAITTEESLDYAKLFESNVSEYETNITNAISRATCSTALALKANVIITATSSGITARAISKFKPEVPIIAISDSERVIRQLSLSWGVYAILAPKMTSTDNMFNICTQIAKNTGLVKSGDLAVLTAGIPLGKVGSTNLLKVQIIE